MTHLADELNPMPSNAEHKPAFDGIWRLTECIGCPGALIHRALNCPENEVNPETLALFYEGYLHEYDMKNRLRKRGLDFIEYGSSGAIEGMKNGLKHPDLPVITHPDGYDPATREVLEFKSIGDVEEYHHLRDGAIQASEHWVRQTQGMIGIMNANGARVIPKVRKTGWILPSIEIKSDVKVQTEIWDTVESACHLLSTASDNSSCSELTAWGMGCSRDFITRLFCNYYGGHCQKDKQQAQVYLGELLTEYAGYDVKSDYFADKAKALRVTIGEMVENLGDVQTLDGIEAVIRRVGGRWSHKIDIARKMLDKSVFNKIFSYTDGKQGLVISIPASLKETIRKEIV